MLNLLGKLRQQAKSIYYHVLSQALEYLFKKTSKIFVYIQENY